MSRFRAGLLLGLLLGGSSGNHFAIDFNIVGSRYRVVFMSDVESRWPLEADRRNLATTTAWKIA